MNKKGKRVLEIVIPGLIEFALYLMIRPANPELFLFICSSIFIIILFYSIVYTTTNIAASSPIPCAYSLSWKTNVKKEQFLLKANIKNKIMTGIKDPKNIIYFSYLIANFIVYIIVI